MYVNYFLEISKNCWLFDWYKLATLRVFLFCTLNLIFCLTPSSRNNFLGFLLHISAWSRRNIYQILPPTGALRHQRFLCSCSLWIKFDILTVDEFMLGKRDARVHPRWCRGIAVEKSGDRCQEPCSSWRGSWLSSWPDHNPWSQYPFHRNHSLSGLAFIYLLFGTSKCCILSYGSRLVLAMTLQWGMLAVWASL